MDALAFDFPGGAPLSAFLSLAAAGDMGFSYAKGNPNRDAFLASRGIDPRDFIGLELAHSKKIIFLDGGGFTGPGKADGLLCARPGPCLGVTVSDCMPIWIYDSASGSYGVLHSGWEGTGIVLEAFRLLGEKLGSEPGSLRVLLGPCIGPCCYRVSPERAVQYMEAFGPEAALAREGAWYLDLPKANLEALRKAGAGMVSNAGICTACDPRLGSFRRQGKQAFVRMLAGIAPSFPLDREMKTR